MTNWVDDFYELNPDADKRGEDGKTVKKKEYILDMFNVVLPALDRGDKFFYKKRTADEQKELAESMWILMRFMSSSKALGEHHLMMVNDLVNKDFNLFVRKAQSNKAGHAELQWMLLALCGSGTKQYHEKISSPKGVKKDKLEEAVLRHFPLFRDDELALFMKLNSTDDLKSFFKDNGYDDLTIKELFKTSKRK